MGEGGGGGGQGGWGHLGGFLTYVITRRQVVEVGSIRRLLRINTTTPTRQRQRQRRQRRRRRRRQQERQQQPQQQQPPQQQQFFSLFSSLTFNVTMFGFPYFSLFWLLLLLMLLRRQVADEGPRLDKDILRGVSRVVADQ